MEKDALEKFIVAGLSSRKIAGKTGKSATAVRHWLKKYGLKTTPAPKDDMLVYRCGKCGDADPANFYGHKKKMCGPCHNTDCLDRGREKRRRIVSHMGGKCVICSFDKYECALHVHHLDRSVKDSHFHQHRGWSWDRILKEIDGCVLLCGNCHPAVHAGLIEI